jgi:HEAT repeat protein
MSNLINNYYSMKPVKEIIRILSADEPDYSSICNKLTEEDYLTVKKLTKHRSLAIATRAVICLGWEGSEKWLDGIITAAKSDNPTLRLAAVQALGKIKGAGRNSEAVDLIGMLLNDKDLGVKKFALKTTGAVGSQESMLETASENPADIFKLREKIKEISEGDQNDRIKKLAQDVFEQLKPSWDTKTL